jgi:transposase
MAIRYTIKLTEEEISRLEEITSSPTRCNAKTYMNARALLLSDASAGKPRKTAGEIAEVLGVATRTIEHLKRRMCEDGLDAALGLEKEKGIPRNFKFDGDIQAKVIATACTAAPAGHCRWTVRLLADRLVELEIVDSISAMTVQRILKKTNFSLTAPPTGKSRPARTPSL